MMMIGIGIPSSHKRMPRPMSDLLELLSRLKHQFELPTPKMKVCRGRMFSVADYTVDVAGMGFADVVGGENERKAG